jgi:general L-amino acid transport system permease protein
MTMADNSFVPIAPRPSPIKTTGFVPWARQNLFADWRSSLTTLFVGALIVYVLPGLLNWAFFQSIFRADADACQAARGLGACWGVVTEKYRIILFGRYPYEEQ